jgi:hypothetical protein
MFDLIVLTKNKNLTIKHILRIKDLLKLKWMFFNLCRGSPFSNGIWLFNFLLSVKWNSEEGVIIICTSLKKRKKHLTSFQIYLHLSLHNLIHSHYTVCRRQPAVTDCSSWQPTNAVLLHSPMWQVLLGVLDVLCFKYRWLTLACMRIELETSAKRTRRTNHWAIKPWM